MPRPILILGPTAGGKSDFAVDLARQLGAAEIISADSMQVYKHLDAGTAKPPARLRRRAPHHLIDIVEPSSRFTVAIWLRLAENLLADFDRLRVRPIIVGGTNLYIKAFLEGLFSNEEDSDDVPGVDEAFRQSLADRTPQQLHEELKPIDPAAAQRIHPNDRKRLVRALEVHHLTGTPISQLQTQWGKEKPPSGEAEKPESHRATEPPSKDSGATSSLGGSVASWLGGFPSSPYRHDPIILGLHYAAEAINPRINLRVKAMFFPEKVEPELAAEVCPRGESLVDETRRLLDAGVLQPDQQAAEALGYKQVLQHFQGQMSLDDAFEKTKILTRRFAKQQRTWLRRFQGVHWIDAANTPRERWVDDVLPRIAAPRK